MQDAKEEIRSRLNIEDIIGEYVRLKRAGRSFKGLSPFTQEKTPSFMVSPDKHVWYDFSSNRGGDIFNFIMVVEGLDFRGALEFLARKAGVDLSLYQNQSADFAKKKEKLREILELATQYFQQTLLKNQRALEYTFKTRGIDSATVQRFRIGYAPNTQSALVDWLEKKGFSAQYIKDAGLANSKGGDLFRARMIVPLMDPSGQVIGFTGRLIEDIKNAPKYLNTPQTLLYDKSRHVFGLHMAKEAIRHEDTAVLVEGNLDVVTSHQYGVKNVVATAGTALTEQQLKSLQRLSGNVVLAFDNDRAGLAATERTIPIAQQLGIDLRVVNLTGETKDPDELIRQDVARWTKAIKEALPVVDWVIAEYESRYDLATAEGKKAFSSAAIAVAAEIEDEIEKEHYQRIIAEKTKVSLEAVTRKLYKNSTVTAHEPLKKITTSLEKRSDNEAYQDTLLSLAALDPAVRTLLIDVPEESLVGDERRSFLAYLRQHTEGTLDDVMPEPLQQIETYVRVLLLRADEKYGGWSSIERYDETAKLIKLIKNDMKQQKKQLLMHELRIAEQKQDETRVKALRKELNSLIKETGK